MSAVADSAAWRRRIGAADRVRECCQSAASSRQRKRARNGSSAGAWSGAKAADNAVAHRECISFLARRDCRFGRSSLHETVFATALTRELSQLTSISISWSVLLFALVSSLVTGAIFGLAPALHAGRVDLTHALKEGARGSTDPENKHARAGCW